MPHFRSLRSRLKAGHESGPDYELVSSPDVVDILKEYGPGRISRFVISLSSAASFIIFFMCSTFALSIFEAAAGACLSRQRSGVGQ